MLKNIAIESAVVVVGEEPTTFYGLTFLDVSRVLSDNRDSLSAIFTIVERAGISNIADLNETSITEIGFRLLAEAPELTARLIAASAREPEQWEVVMEIPAPAQLEMLREITRLTLVDGLAFGEFLGNVVAAVAMMKKTLPQVTATVLKKMVQTTMTNTTKTETP